MSSEYNRTVRDFVNTIKQASESKTKPYDIQAEVLRTDGDIAWVHIPGGVSETPVQMMVNAKRGDTVQVRIAGGHAWLYGNQTAPPTDDTEAKEAKHAVMKNNQTIAEISTMVEEADEHATYALVSANGKNTVYHSEVEPTGGDYREGDTWFNASEGYAIYTWDGSSWVKEEFGSDAIANMAITNAKIADATIDAAKISSVDVGSLTGGYINAGHINTQDLVIGDSTLGRKITEMDQKDADLESDLEDLGEDIDGLSDDITDLNEDLDTLENRVEAVYGTCYTGGTTTRKEVTCDNFVPFEGATLAVKFYYYSSVDAPTMIVKDSDGNTLVANKAIYSQNEVISSASNVVKWSGGTVIHFRYNNSKWYVDDEPSKYYCDCSTVAGNSIKVISPNTGNILITNNTTITVRFTNGNTCKGNLYLNVSSTRTSYDYVLVDSDYPTSSDPFLWNNSEELTFVKDSYYWRLEGHYAAKTATKYITYIDSDNGIHVHNGSDTSDYALLNSYGMSVYKGGSQKAFFGDYISLGGDNSGEVNTIITPDSMSITADGDPSFAVQTTGEKTSTNVRMLYNIRKRDVYSGTAPSSKTKSWTIQLPPNAYTIYLGSTTRTFTVSASSYTPTSQISISETVSSSSNTLTFSVNSVTYISGSIAYVTVKITQTASRSTSNNKYITWAGSGIYYTKAVYESSIIWNGNNHSNVGNNYYINGGTNYSDIGEMNCSTDVSVSANTVATIGSITLDEGVYVITVRARFKPTTTTQGTQVRTTIHFSSTQNDETASDSRYNELPASTSSDRLKWNQHHAIFMAAPAENDNQYFVSGYANVAGKWLMTNTAAFQIRAIKIR